MPNPICQNINSTFYNLDRVQVNGSLYDGNATEYDWVGEYLLKLSGSPASMLMISK